MLRTELKYITVGITANYIDTAKLLHAVYNNELWQVWGFKSFSDYTNNELGINRRKALHFVRIWDTLTIGCQANPDRIKKIGWSKIVVILPVVATNPQKWIKLAETLAKDELRHAVLEARGKLEIKRRFMVSLTPEAYKIVEWALQKAEEQSGTPNRALLLEYICAEYGSNTPPATDDKVTVAEDTTVERNK